jgi:DNA-binding transcriptional MerR regulator
MGELPPKLFFRIGEVAGLVGVEPHVLRYWEREFRSIRPTKSAKGQRVYTRKDVENLLRVRDLLYRDGFTIAGAKKKLQRGGDATQEALDDEGTEIIDEGASSAEMPVASAIELDLEPTTAPIPSRLLEAREHVGGARAGQSGLRRELNGAARASSEVRERLLALRDEVEAFLAELSTPAGRGERTS